MLYMFLESGYQAYSQCLDCFNEDKLKIKLKFYFIYDALLKCKHNKLEIVF